MEHRQRQRIIAAGPKLQPAVGSLRELGLARVDDDEGRITLESIAQPEAELAVGARIEGIVAPDQDAAGLDRAVVVTDREIAVGEQTDVDTGQEALGRARLAPVGRTDGVGEARDEVNVVAARARAQGNVLGPLCFSDVDEACRDLVERLVPGDALPALAPAFPPRV